MIQHHVCISYIVLNVPTFYWRRIGYGFQLKEDVISILSRNIYIQNQWENGEVISSWIFLSKKQNKSAICKKSVRHTFYRYWANRIFAWFELHPQTVYHRFNGGETKVEPIYTLSECPQYGIFKSPDTYLDSYIEGTLEELFKTKIKNVRQTD